MTERPFNRYTEGGTVEVVDGWLRVFDSRGQELAAIRPDGPLWCYVVEKASEEVRKRLLAARG